MDVYDASLTSDFCFADWPLLPGGCGVSVPQRSAGCKNAETRKHLLAAVEWSKCNTSPIWTSGTARISDRNIFIPRSALVHFTLTFVLLWATQTAAQDIETRLPLTGTDTITILHTSSEQTRRISGRIEDISGESLTLRRGGRGSVEFYRVTDIVELSFSRSDDFEKGLQHAQNGQARRALEYFDRALKGEVRSWAWNELQATAAKTAVRGGERMQAVERINQIFSKDRRTRHVSSLPLVWDSRLPTRERLPEIPDGLDSDSLVEQLAAASAVLHDPVHRVRARSVLERLRRFSGLKRVSDLAEIQLWRMHLLEHPLTPTPILNVWNDRIRHLPVAARHGPQFTIGRCLLQMPDHDRAALAFLWGPLMIPDDEALAAQSLREGIYCLNMAGRRKAAEQLTSELKRRFPETSAALSIADDASGQLE